MENALRYHIEVDLSQKDSPHAQLIRLTGRNKKVLEVGPATGYVTKVLQQRGCRVSCIETDAEAAEVAAEFCERMVVADVESIDLPSKFPDERFDVVTFGDVLEHLVDPMAVLIRVKDILKPRGYVVASVPNVAHASIRLALLGGRFQYTEKGLLDRTHLRFFTEESLAGLFHDAGYEVRAWRRIIIDPFATEVEVREKDYPSFLAEAARGDIQGLTYQFVVRAYPVRSTTNGRPVLSSPDGAVSTNLVEGLQRWESELQELRKKLQANEAALADARDALADANANVDDREALLLQRQRSLDETQAQLAAMNESLGYRLLESYRRRVGRLFPADSLRSAPYRLLVKMARRGANARRAKRTDRDLQLSEDEYGERGDKS